MKTAKDHLNNQINNVLDALPNDERVNHSMLKKILEKGQLHLKTQIPYDLCHHWPHYQMK